MDDPEGKEKAAESLRESQPNASGPDAAAGGMGVSSEREGHAGPRQHATDGMRDNSLSDGPTDDDAPPEQSAGGHEENPAALERENEWPSKDPRSDGDHPHEQDPGLRRPD